MRFAYADPPYPGMAHRYPEKTEVNHGDLLDCLMRQYPDGWALSTSSVALRDVLPLCPPDVRVMAWVKPWAVFRPHVGVAYAWEPVLLYGGRKRERQQATIRDYVSARATRAQRIVGAKPWQFYVWLFQVLNLEPDDSLIDLFPGTNSLATVRALYHAQGSFSFVEAEA